LSFPDFCEDVFKREVDRKRLFELDLAKYPGLYIRTLDMLVDNPVTHYTETEVQTFPIRASDFGYARRAWATEQYFGISGGKGDPRQLRRHISSLRIAYTDCGETQIRKRLQERIGKLMGGSSVLWVGDVSPSAAQRRKELAERTAEAMRGAMHHGVVPGGEVVLLECKNLLLEKYHQAQDTDERAAYRILAGAVEAPFQALLQNAGEDYHAILSQMELTGEGFGYDICKREVVHMVSAGIVDSSEVIRQAAYRAIVGAALALTVDVLVHRAKPPSVIPTR
jgi:chaperonin GroEL